MIPCFCRFVILSERFDRGIESTDATGAGYVEEQAPPRPTENSALDAEALAKSMLEMELEAPDAFASTRNKVPTMSDMLIAYATVPGESPSRMTLKSVIYYYHGDHWCVLVCYFTVALEICW